MLPVKPRRVARRAHRIAVMIVVLGVLAALPPVGIAANGVTREGGSNPPHTSAIVSRRHFSPGVDVVYIVNNSTGGLKHAMAAAPAAAKLGGPILFVSRDSISSYVRNELDRLNPDSIIVVGSSSWVSSSVVNQLDSFTTGTVTREGGTSPADTSAIISSRHFSPGVGVVYLVNSSIGVTNAMVAGPAAASLDGPILLVGQDSVPSSVRTELHRLDPDQIIVVGDTSHVSDSIFNKLDNFTSGPITREAGTDSAQTSAIISRRHFSPGVGAVYIANDSAGGLRHAWPAGAAAAKLGGPILLVSPNSISRSVARELGRLDPATIIVVGTETYVSSNVMVQLEAYIAPPAPINPPVAIDDNFGNQVSGCGWQEAVLENDTDADDAAVELTVTAVSDPPHGTATILETRLSGVTAPRAVRYQSDAGYTGEDTFTYTVSDPNGGADVGQISVNVTASTADADSDGVADACDPFAADPTNGSGASLPFSLDFGGGDGGLVDSGFVGVMTNSTDASLNLLDADVGLNGLGALVNPTVDEGDSVRSGNDQRNALQANLEAPSGSFVVHGVVCAPYPTAQFASTGIYFGTGDQDNYIKLVVGWNASSSANQLHDGREVNGGGATVASKVDAAIAAESCIDLYLAVNKAAGTYSPTYSLDGGTTRIGLGGVSSLRTVPASWLDDSAQLAVGIISTSQGPSPEIVATWDLLEVTAT
ncbi:MAG TPA: cell wall-binding repeat-containing protein [Candidatus Limnocylindria bacterium]|nr:cell wall-binding repeat-containing protein [Candidatus Limnocylindria bacterium]